MNEYKPQYNSTIVLRLGPPSGDTHDKYVVCALMHWQKLPFTYWCWKEKMYFPIEGYVLKDVHASSTTAAIMLFKSL